MENKIKNQIKTTAIKYIRTLMVVGLGAFALMLLISLYVLSFVQTKHQSTQELSNKSFQLFASFEKLVREEQETIRELLTTSDEVAVLRQDQQPELVPLGVMEGLKEFGLKHKGEEQLDYYKSIKGKGHQWQKEWQDNDRALAHGMIAIRNQIFQLSILAEEWQGQERLDQVSKLRQSLKNGESGLAADESQSRMEQFQVVSTLSEVRRELADFTVLFEQFLVVNKEEELEDYLGNEFRPSLLRLNFRLKQLSIQSDKRLEGLTVCLDKIILLLLGEHFQVSEELQYDQLKIHGTYGLVAQRIQLKNQKELLEQESLSLDHSHSQLREKVVSLINEKRDLNFQQSNNSFRWGWRWMLMIGLFGGGICSLMIFRIARIIKSQISILSEAHSQLEFQSQALETKNLSLAKEVQVRLNAEQEIETAREFLQKIIDAIPDSLTVIDNDYNIHLANKSACLQNSQDSIQDKKCFEVSYGYQSPCGEMGDECPIEKARNSLREEIVEHSKVMPDGECVYFEVRVIPLINNDGEVDQFIEVSRDVTTEKLRRIALEESEVRFRSLFEANADSVIIIDDKKKVHCNESTLSIFGFKSKEEFCSHYPPDLSPAFQPNGAVSRNLSEQYLNEAIEKGSCHFEWVHQKPDGSLFNADILLSAITFGTEQKSIIQSVIRDVTKRKKLEKELHENNKRFVRILDTAATAVFEVDPNGIITSINREFTDITGYTEEDIIGKKCLILEGDKCTSNCGLFTSESPGVILRKQCTITNKQGKKVSILKNCSLAYDDEGKITGGLESFIDVTELVEAREKAEDASRAKAEFLANMSHEIRTPMNGILGMNGLLLDTILTQEQSDYVGRAQVCAESLLNLINDILDFSKVEAGKLEFEFIDFSLYATIEELNDILSVRPQEKGIEYISNIEPDVPYNLQGDPGRLRQVLTNLVGNAVKFTGEGEIQLHVKVKNKNEERVRLLFEVSDTGMGIPPEKINELFNPFTQADSSTTRQFGGTGLGLSICHRLVEKMNGEIGVTSTVGVGSTFWFEAEFALQGNETNTEVLELPTDIHGVHILIVDDNETNRYLLIRQLEAWQCRPEEAESALEALEKLRISSKQKDPFQIALLDMQMPVMDGMTLGLKIKNNPALIALHTVMMTSMGMRGDANKIKEMGFSAYLTKPVKQSDLYDCLAMLSGKQSDKLTKQKGKIITHHTLQEQKIKRGRVLLVEDNVTNLLVGTKLLEQLGVRVDGVGNGKEAVEALSSFSYNIVFMDIQMPVMDGFEATTVIRDPNSKVLNHQIPIVAMTAHAMSGDREMCLNAGMNDYVSKPINKDNLRKVLDFHLRESAKIPFNHPEKDQTDNKSGASSELLIQLKDDKDLQHHLLKLFFTETAEELARFKTGIETESDEQLIKRTHCLRVNAVSVGAQKLAELASTLELCPRKQNRDTSQAQLMEFETEFERLQKNYPHLINIPGSG